MRNSSQVWDALRNCRISVCITVTGVDRLVQIRQAPWFIHRFFDKQINVDLQRQILTHYCLCHQKTLIENKSSNRNKTKDSRTKCLFVPDPRRQYSWDATSPVHWHHSCLPVCSEGTTSDPTALQTAASPAIENNSFGFFLPVTFIFPARMFYTVVHVVTWPSELTQY